MGRSAFYAIVALLPAFFYAPHGYADVFKNSKYETCFTPGENCTALIVNTIKKSKSSIYVQAYSFTSAPIAEALLQAKKRGVTVKAILDKSQFTANYSASKFLLNQGIPVWKDQRVAIAHNKVIIIDNATVITGSFNFTKSAQERNAENVLIITDTNLAHKYLENWNKRMVMSDHVNKVE